LKLRWLFALLLSACVHSPAPAADQDLWPLHGQLKTRRWVDLTHPFDASIPHWKGFGSMTRQTLYDYAKDGFRAELFCHVG
jgi:hypothetical protein